FQELRSQISTREPAPMTASSRSRPAYVRSFGVIVTRPCLSGISSLAPDRNTRKKCLFGLAVVEAPCIWVTLRSDSRRGYAYKHVSCILVITVPATIAADDC